MPVEIFYVFYKNKNSVKTRSNLTPTEKFYVFHRNIKFSDNQVLPYTKSSL